MGCCRYRRLRWNGSNGNIYPEKGLIDVKATTDFADS